MVKKKAKKSSSPSAFQKLMDRQKEIYLWNSVERLVSWDESTYMPEGGSGLKGEQKALLMTRLHHLMTDPQVGEWLGAVDVKKLDELSKKEVHEIKRQYDRATRMPERLVTELAVTTTEARGAWVLAREKSEFKRFEPHLEKVVKLKREEAKCLDFKDPYDALLDLHEPGGRAKDIEKLFKELEIPLKKLLGKIQGSQGKKPDRALLQRQFPIKDQEKLCNLVLEKMGFSFKHGRVDLTTHPFCSGISAEDVRLATRYDENFFPSAFYSGMHEGGHGLYEQGLDEKAFGSVRSRAASFGLHESQSRLWENFVGRGLPFWKWLYPIAQKHFPGALHDVKVEDFVFAINLVEPSFVRVEADEVTYNLHIILRFDLERRLLSGDLKAKDVPAAWNQRFKEIFGIVPKKDADGCLQDIHWSWGSIGYFPTYTLGNLYAAQMFEAAARDIKGLEKGFEKGELAPLKNWLKKNVHEHGQRWDAPELCERVTKRPLSVKPLVDYLERKFSGWYQL